MNPLEKLNAEINRLEARSALLDEAVELLRTIRCALEVSDSNLKSYHCLPYEITDIVERVKEIK